MVANLIVAQLLLLDSENPEKDIMLYINSPGGSVTAGLAIYDTIQHIRSDVNTICLGQAASIGTFSSQQVAWKAHGIAAFQNSYPSASWRSAGTGY